jgi:hypothetical protein
MELNWRPSRSQLRSFSGVAVCLFGCLGFIGWHRDLQFATASQHVPSLLAWAGALWAVVGLIEPRGALPLYRLLTAAGFPFGLISAWLFLLLLFFAVITPLALLRRSLRPRSPPTGSAWVECKRPTDKSDYFRQF